MAAVHSPLSHYETWADECRMSRKYCSIHFSAIKNLDEQRWSSIQLGLKSWKLRMKSPHFESEGFKLARPSCTCHCWISRKTIVSIIVFLNFAWILSFVLFPSIFHTVLVLKIMRKHQGMIIFG